MSIQVRDGAGVLQTVASLSDIAAIDDQGNPVNPDAFAHVLTYNSDGTIATDAFTNGSYTWTQTFTYTSGNLTGISKWVRS